MHWPDFLLVKTDSTGNESWSKTYGGEQWDIASSIVQTGDGGYAIAGFTNSFGSIFEFNAWLVKTDAFGLTEVLEFGLVIMNADVNTVTFHRGLEDPYWNYVSVRIWVVKENP